MDGVQTVMVINNWRSICKYETKGKEKSRDEKEGKVGGIFSRRVFKRDARTRGGVMIIIRGHRECQNEDQEEPNKRCVRDFRAADGAKLIP